MKLTPLLVILVAGLPPLCQAQKWEVGATSGYNWNSNPSIVNAGLSSRAGLHPGYVLGAVFGEDPYQYIGGEIRYLLEWGAPRLQFQGTRADMSGYSNVLVYDLLVHMRPRESHLRPYVAGGAGIKIYTATGSRDLRQPLAAFAVLVPGTQVEPAISAGGGVKYLVAHGVLLRADFRAYMTPLPNELFRTTRTSSINGWIFNLVPQVGISYVF